MRIIVSLCVLVACLSGCGMMTRMGSIDVPGFGEVPVGAVSRDLGVHGPVARLGVYFGDIRPGQTGSQAVCPRLNINGTAVVSVLGYDAAGNEFYVKEPIRWKVLNQDIVSVSPAEGRLVTLKGMKEGNTDIQVEAEGVIATVMGGVAVY